MYLCDIICAFKDENSKYVFIENLNSLLCELVICVENYRCFMYFVIDDPSKLFDQFSLGGLNPIHGFKIVLCINNLCEKLQIKYQCPFKALCTYKLTEEVL